MSHARSVLLVLWLAGLCCCRRLCAASSGSVGSLSRNNLLPVHTGGVITAENGKLYVCAAWLKVIVIRSMAGSMCPLEQPSYALSLLPALSGLDVAVKYISARSGMHKKINEACNNVTTKHKDICKQHATKDKTGDKPHALCLLTEQLAVQYHLLQNCGLLPLACCLPLHVR